MWVGAQVSSRSTPVAGRADTGLQGQGKKSGVVFALVPSTLFAPYPLWMVGSSQKPCLDSENLILQLDSAFKSEITYVSQLMIQNLKVGNTGVPISY